MREDKEGEYLDEGGQGQRGKKEQKQVFTDSTRQEGHRGEEDKE